MGRRIESLKIPGPVGLLEALLEEPEDRQPVAAVLVCHPHPQHGGTMHTRVVHRTARGLRHAGAVVLRFNYRGVHLSEGSYDHGIGEIEDARTCLKFLRGRYPDLPYAVAGFSFGSRIALKLAVDYPEARKVIAIGYPTKYPERGYLLDIRVPKVFVQSTQDEHGPREDFEPFFAGLPEPKEMIWIEAKDHFFADNLEAFEEAIARVGPL
ncbi:MAG: alpha/beta hydrolase [Acidobacteriota bacterium]|jgi:alpha/beta superfamily hydrolase